MGLEIKILDLGESSLETSSWRSKRARVVGRLLETVPGPVLAAEDYPGPTTADIQAARTRGAVTETVTA
jgi:hypothetical protein